MTEFIHDEIASYFSGILTKSIQILYYENKVRNYLSNHFHHIHRDRQRIDFKTKR
jgi:hypothetical protein